MRGILTRLVLAWFPAAFRREHGDEMARIIAEQERGAAARGRVWRFRVGALLDGMRAGLATRWDAHRDGDTWRTQVMLRARRHQGRREGGGMGNFARDIRDALRSLRGTPGFTAVAVLTIALGIGASTAIFSVVDAILLEPLPYEDDHELVVLWGEMRARDVTHFPMSPPTFDDIRRESEALEDVAAVFTFSQPLVHEGRATPVDVAAVTANFFAVLGVEARVGRTFVAADGLPDAEGAAPGTPGALPTMVVLSHGLWMQRFGGDPAVVGRTLDLGGQSAEVVGVLPADFELLMPPEAGLATAPALYQAARLDVASAPRNNVFLRPVARLADGATLGRAQAEVDGVAAQVRRTDETSRTADFHLRVAPLRADLAAGPRPLLSALLGAVLFVLLIACANVSNLLLVRSAGRSREMAIRAALGGERLRLLRQLLVESGVLAMLGAALGIGLAALGVQWLPGLHPGELPRLDGVGLDGSVLGFTLVATVGAALLFGTLPALQGSRVELVSALKERGDTDRANRGRRVRRAVVVLEVALSLVLLVGTGLMIRSFANLSAADPGYRPDGLVALEIPVPFARFPDPASREAILSRIHEALEGVPGVEGAASAFPLPLSGDLMNGRYGPEEALADPTAYRQAVYRLIRPGYFEVMGSRIVEGRPLTAADHADSASVAVVDEVLAARMWPGESAVGKRIWVRLLGPEPQAMEVVGVAEHQRSETLDTDGRETIFFPDRLMGGIANSWVVRVGGETAAVAAGIRSAVRGVDPGLPVADVRPFSRDVGEAMGPTRFALALIGAFGAVALLLAVVGLYGVLAGLVRSRTPEIGVRVALGAPRGSIRGMVLRDGLGLAALGVAVGLGVAGALAGVMDRLVVGVSPADPPTYVAVALVFMAVAGAACWIPMRRALSVDPLVALREE